MLRRHPVHLPINYISVRIYSQASIWSLLALLLAPFSEARNAQLEDVYVRESEDGQWILSSSRSDGESFGFVQGGDSGCWWQFKRKQTEGLAEWAFKQGNVTLLSPWFASLRELTPEASDALIRVSRRDGVLLLPDPQNPLALPIEMERWVSLEKHLEVRDVALPASPSLIGCAADDTLPITFDYSRIAYLSAPLEGIGDLFDQQVVGMQERFIRNVRERQERLQMGSSGMVSPRQDISVYFVEVGSEAVWMLFYADEYAFLSRDVKLATMLLKKSSNGNWLVADPAPVDWKALKPHRIQYEANDPFGKDLEQPTIAPEGWLPRNIGIWSAGVQNPPAAGITFAEFQR